MVKDIWGQEIKNGDFVVSASKSEGGMVMGVMKDVKSQTRVRVDYSDYKKKWVPHDKATRMYTLERTLKLPDEMIVKQNLELFDVMNDVREKLSLPTNRELKTQVTLDKMLEQLI